MIRIVINGAERRFERPLAVSELIAQMSLSGKRIAVECNGEIVPKSAHGSTLVLNGDRLEVVAAVGGG